MVFIIMNTDNIVINHPESSGLRALRLIDLLTE